MTDKQIIIDGVDVSGCRQYIPRHMEDYDIDTLDYCRYYFKPCKDVDVKYCYFKQLKAKEQECKEFKKQVCGLRPELKSIINKTCSKYNIKAKAYHKEIVEIINNLDKYKQTLDEIEEYLDAQQKYFDGEDYHNLLDIINKVKGEINEES